MAVKARDDIADQNKEVSPKRWDTFSVESALQPTLIQG